MEPIQKLRGLGPALGRAAHLCRACMSARCAQFDVTPAQAHVLIYLLLRGGQAPQCEVTEHLRVRPPTANGILDRMEEKGLVERTISETDARRRQILLTERGREQQALLQAAHTETEQVITKGMTEAEAEAFRALLSRAIVNLEEDRTQ